jgi:cytochrome c oxidase assembly protein subunit 11
VNHAKTPVTGTATFNVTPAKAGIYFDKLQCFCFTQQHLGPGEGADLSVSFFVDPDIASDPATADVDTITLSYTMFRAKEGEAPVRSSALPATTAPNN